MAMYRFSGLGEKLVGKQDPYLTFPPPALDDRPRVRHDQRQENIPVHSIFG